MVQYKKGRLYSSGMSFPMVEEYYLNAECSVNFENGLGFFNESQDIAIEFEIREKKGTVDGILKDAFAIIVPKVIIPITPFELNGFEGCYTMYKDSSAEYFEAHLDIGNDLIFSYCVEATDGQRIRKLMQQPFFQDLLKGVRKES